MRTLQSPKTVIAIATLVVLAAAGYYMSLKKEHAPLFPQDIVFPEDTQKPSQPGTATQEPVLIPVPAGNSNTATTPGVSKPKTVQNSSYGSQSTSRKVALAQAEKGNWYASIVSEVEGYRAKPYFDNKGIAIGNGWNVGQQSRKRNTELAFGIEMDSVSTEALLPYSGVQNPTSLPNVAITPEQSSKAVELMREQYEAPMRKLVPSWSQLKRNEQDALVYHAYKVGAGGAAKYTSMLAALKTYAANPSEENKLKVAGTFTYKYTINGTVYQDARSALYLGALFTSPEAYTYLLGTTKAPADFGKVAQLSGQKIDTSKPAEDQIQDDYGKAKEVLISRGIPYTVILQAAPQATAPAPTKPRVRNNAIVFWGI